MRVSQFRECVLTIHLILIHDKLLDVSDTFESLLFTLSDPQHELPNYMLRVSVAGC